MRRSLAVSLIRGLCLLCSLSWQLGAAAEVAASDPIAAIRDRLRAEFDGYLADPAAYARLAAGECAQFPEGDLYPYALPALAYANLALAGADRAATRERQRALIELALPRVAARVGAPGGDLAGLPDYGRQAAFLGTLGLALGAYRLSTSDQRYATVQARVAEVLARALAERAGATIDSYPEYSWTYDTTAALLALRLHERTAGGAASAALVAKHLAWLQAHAADAATGLPLSVQASAGAGGSSPRGCDLSMRVCLLAQLDRAAARDLYRRYVDAFWSDDGAIAGFREWPRGHADLGDIDSGPVLRGIGMTATGVGLGSCLAMADQPRLARLAGELGAVAQLRRLALIADPTLLSRALGAAGSDERYVSGFLYGDAVLFYALTWVDWRTAVDGDPRP